MVKTSVIYVLAAVGELGGTCALALAQGRRARVTLLGRHGGSSFLRRHSDVSNGGRLQTGVRRQRRRLPRGRHAPWGWVIDGSPPRTFANPTRRELVHVLCKGGRTPSELAEALEVSRPNVSQHLSVLQREGLVKRSRQDGRVLWEVVDPRLSEACALIDEILGHELAQRARALELER